MTRNPMKVQRRYLRSPCEFGGLSGAMEHARNRGYVTLVLANGDLRLYYMEDNRLKQKTWASSTWVAV